MIMFFSLSCLFSFVYFLFLSFFVWNIFNTHNVSILFFCTTTAGAARISYLVCATFVYIKRIDFSCDSASALATVLDIGDNAIVVVVVGLYKDIFYIMFFTMLSLSVLHVIYCLYMSAF